MRTFIVKLEDLKDKFKSLEEKYEIAKAEDDIELIEEIEQEYQGLRRQLYTNEAYFASLSTKEAKTKRVLENQKKEYKKNKSYINTVEKSNTLEEYIKNTNRKEFNLVKRNFKKFALIGGAAVLIFGLTTCKTKKNAKTKDEVVKITTTEEIKEVTEEIATENKTSEEEIAKETIKLNQISKKIIEEYNKEETKEEKPEEEIKEEQEIYYEEFEPTVVIEELDPHISNYGAEVVIEEEIVSEEEVTEKEEVEYGVETNYKLEEVVVITDEGTIKETKEEIKEGNVIKEEIIPEKIVIEEPEEVEYEFEEEEIEYEFEEEAKTLKYSNGGNINEVK